MVILISIGFVLAVGIFWVRVHQAKVIDKSAGLGEIPLDVMKARYTAEDALLFLDYSAKYSLYDAVFRAGEDGGLADPVCGRYVFPLWNEKGKSCFPTGKEAVLSAFDERLQGYLSQYPLFPLNSYEYDVKGDGSSVTVIGISGEDLAVPLIAGRQGVTGVASLVNVKAGLGLPMEGDIVITSCFGTRFISGKKDPDWHDGVDMRADENTRIFSIAPGTVVEVCEEWVGACDCSVAKKPQPGRACSPAAKCKGRCGDFGNTLVIKHGDNLYSRYSHMKSIEVNVGDAVSKGMFIGFSGDTGNSEKAHLDFKIYSTGNYKRRESEEPGKNPFCMYTDDVLATFNAVGDSCKKNLVNGKLSKDTFKNDCSRIDPKTYEAVAVLDKTAVKSPKAVEMTDKSGAVHPDNVAKVNAYVPIIAKYAAKYGVEDAYIKAIMTHESPKIDPRALGPKGKESDREEDRAWGLMQIVPNQNHKVCVKECGFSSAPLKEEYFTPEKSICCSTAIFQSKYLKKSKVYPACCNRAGCVREAREYVEWEAALRGYNGWGCGTWGDPHYVETVMGYYYFYGGTPGIAEAAYQNQVGAYRIKPNFKTGMAYNLSAYAEVASFVSGTLLPGFTGQDAETYLQGMIERFNAVHQDLVMQRMCGDYPEFYAFAESLFDCLNTTDTECACELKLQGTADAVIQLLPDSIQLQEWTGVVVDVNLPFDMPIAVKGLGSVSKEYVSAERKNGNFKYEGVDGDAMYLWKSGDVLTVQRDWGTGACTIEKDKYALCVEQKDTKIPRIVDKKLAFLPVRLKFSVFLPKNTVPTSP